MEAKELIKENELRLGNYVYYGFTNDLVKWGFEDWEQISHDLEEINYYNPIPLTEEWLLKAGFQGSEKYSFIHISAKIELMNISNKYYRGYYQGNSIHVDIKHVHQLQNLFYALTGEELTFND